jgi:hypothetical protein
MKSALTTDQSRKSALCYNTVPELLDGVILRYITMQHGRASLFGIVQSCASEGFEHHAVIEAVDCLAAARKVRLALQGDPNLGLFKRIRPIVELGEVQA